MSAPGQWTTRKRRALSSAPRGRTGGRLLGPAPKTSATIRALIGQRPAPGQRRG